MFDLQSTSDTPVTIDHAEPRQLLQRILVSRHFNKSPRIREFLSYICERAFTNRCNEISEQQIAVHVFGRPADYNSSEDTIVRTTARQLRQKLELFHLDEGAGSEWRLTIPKGSYVPLFEKVGDTTDVVRHITDSAPQTQEKAGPSPEATTSLRLVKVIGAAVACGALIWAGVSWVQMMDPRTLFWRALLGSNQATQLVSGDSGLALLQGETHHTIHVREYAAGKFAPQPLGGPTTTTDGPLATFSQRRYTSVADLVLAAKTAAIAEKLGRKLDVKYARDISLRDLKAGNAILVGDPWGNPWVELFSKQLNFDFQIDAATTTHLIVNRAPIGQEDSTYRVYPGDPTNRVYALIALTGGLDGHSRALLLEGTSVAGTDAAVDFLFNSARFPVLLESAIHGGSIDDFEVLLETENVAANGTQAKVIGFRVHHRS